MANGKTRKVLQFNEFDFRHKKVLSILESHPRNMTELVVNAILHYVSCPDANLEITKQSVRKLVAQILIEMQADGSLTMATSPCSPGKGEQGQQAVSASDIAELGDVMGQFRNRGGNP